MAFNPSDFAYHTTFPPNSKVDTDTTFVWKYTTSDNLSSIDANLSTYFSAIDGFVRKGDWIAVMAADKNAWYCVSNTLRPGDGAATVAKFTEVSVFTGQINLP